jgi:ubiquinone/menaquinone biosynthesis C-methylase UbiE
VSIRTSDLLCVADSTEQLITMAYTNPAAYEHFMGRWSSRLAPLFIRFAGVRDGQRILDVGCGTGNLSRALLASGRTIDVVGVDPTASYLSFAREAIPAAHVQFQQGAAEALPFANETFDVALSLLVLQDFTDPDRALLEMARVTRRGGTVAACQWDFADGLPMFSLFWKAAEAVAPQAVARRHQANNPQLPQRRASLQDLAEQWTVSGLEEVRTATLELSMTFGSFDDYWQPFLGGATPTSTFAAAINKETGGALVRTLRDKITDIQPDGSFALPARAWAVAGAAAH